MSWARISEIEIDHCVPIEYPDTAGGPPTLDEKVTTATANHYGFVIIE